MIGALRESQAADGGWGAVPGSRSNTECTALGLMAMEAAAPDGSTDRARAVDWLVSRQNADGGWPVDDVVGESGWVTTLAVMALAGRPGAEDTTIRGVEWILGEQAAQVSWRARLREFLRGSQVVELDFSLNGWPWATGTFSWVEPTTYAMLALKGPGGYGASRRARTRIEEAEAMLLDRVCPGGGWNYGNKRVLDVDLEPYPDTTALALLALQRNPRDPAIEDGFRALDRLMDARASGLALGLGALARRAWQLDPGPWTARLATRFAATGFLGETRSIAFGAMAVAQGSNPFLLARA